MDRMFRVFVAIALVCLLAVTAVGCGTDGGGEVKEPVKEEVKTPYKIGVVVSLTGTYSGLGEPEKNTIEMEVDRINAAGGVNGHPLEVIFEDDATDEAKAVTAATKLIDQDGVIAIIGATGTGQSMAIRGDVQRAGVPQVSMAGGTAITKQLDPLVFQTPWSNTLVIPFQFEYLKAQGIKKIGIISDSGGFGKDGKAVATEEAKNFGFTITGDETFNPGDSDMTAQLTKLKSSGAEAVLMITAGKEAAIVAKNMKQLGMTIPLYGTHGNARAEFIQGAGADAEGFRFAAGKILTPEVYGVDTDSYKVAKDFIDRYTARFGSAPNTFAGHAYDAINLIAEALGTIEGDAGPAALRDALEATDGFVGIGGVFSFSATDHNGLKASDLTMYEIKNGAWTAAK